MIYESPKPGVFVVCLKKSRPPPSRDYLENVVVTDEVAAAISGAGAAYAKSELTFCGVSGAALETRLEGRSVGWRVEN